MRIQEKHSRFNEISYLCESSPLGAAMDGKSMNNESMTEVTKRLEP